MGMFKFITSGTWWLKSDSDPRWNVSGDGQVGMFGMPEEAKQKQDELHRLYGTEPADLEWGYMKD